MSEKVFRGILYRKELSLFLIIQTVAQVIIDTSPCIIVDGTIVRLMPKCDQDKLILTLSRCMHVCFTISQLIELVYALLLYLSLCFKI